MQSHVTQTAHAGPQTAETPASDHPLEPLLHPRAIAVVGASPEGNAGYGFVKKIVDAGFKGRIYPVNPKAAPVLGLPAYPDVASIPDEVDFVIFATPASAVPDLMRQCGQKGVKLAHLFTARLSETGVSELADLEHRIVDIAHESGIRVLGSNGMGLYYAKEGVSFRANFPRDPGDVAFISQSGGNAVGFVYRSSLRGLRFSKVISYGNACDLNESDYLDYLAQDPETRIIAAYIEGVRDGRRFLDALKRAAQAKPVVVLKGGRTQAGTRSVASHTASLAGDDRLWDGLLRQVGALRAESMEDLIDLVVALRFFASPRGRRTGFFGGGGGNSVAAADACEQAGLALPPLTGEMVEELKSLIPGTWMMIGNPVDVSAVGSMTATRRILEMAFHHPEYDAMMVDANVDWAYEDERGQEGVARTLEGVVNLHERTGMPTAVIIRPADAHEEWRRQAVHRERERCVRAGLPVFLSLHSATRTLDRIISYWNRWEDAPD